MKNIFNKKFYMSIVCLLLVAIIPLCSINLINYSNLLATTSQEETIDDDNSASTDDENQENTDGDSNLENGIGNADNSADTGEEQDFETDNTSDDDMQSEDWLDAPEQDEDGVYLIDSEHDLIWLGNYYRDNGRTPFTGTCRLINNISLAIDGSYYWDPIEYFQGTFDGNGYAITSLNCNYADSFYWEPDGTAGHFAIGIFRDITNAHIYDLTVSGNIRITRLQTETSEMDKVLVGGIVGRAIDSVIENCVSQVDIEVFGDYWSLSLGGICSYMVNSDASVSAIRECVNEGTIIGHISKQTYDNSFIQNSYMAGILGYAEGHVIIEDCVNYGQIGGFKTDWDGVYIAGISPGYKGGILGYADPGTTNVNEYAQIHRCVNYGKFVQKAYNYTDLHNRLCTMTFYIGGLVGKMGVYTEPFWPWEKNEPTGAINDSISAVAIDFIDAPINVVIGSIAGYGDTTVDNVAYIASDGRMGVEYDSVFTSVVGWNEDVIDKEDEFMFIGNQFVITEGILGNSYDQDTQRATWTGIEAYRLDEDYITLSFYIKRMDIQIRLLDNGDIKIENVGISIDHSGNGLSYDKPTATYTYYSTIYTETFSLPIINSSYDKYGYRIYKTSNDGNLGDEIRYGGNCSERYRLLFGSGTYDENFTDITIVPELRKISEVIYSDFGVITKYSEEFYQGKEKLTDLSLMTKVEDETEEGSEETEIVGGDVEIYVDDELLSEETVWSMDSVVRIVLLPAENFEVLGLYTERDYNNGNVADRLDKMFNDFGDLGMRVAVEYESDYSRISYQFVISDIVVDLNDEASSEDIDCGDTTTLEFAYTFYAVFTRTALNYNLDVRYDKNAQNGSGEQGYIYGYGERALTIKDGYYEFAVRDDYTLNFFEFGDTSRVPTNVLELSYGSDYFEYPMPGNVQYVAEFSEGKSGYWSTVGLANNAEGLTLAGRIVELNLIEFLIGAGVEPGSTTVITFHRFEGPKYTYHYYLQIADAYEDYETGEYELGTLVGETYLYNRRLISKTNATFGDVTAPVSRIPFNATFTTYFMFDISSPLESYYSDIIDFKNIIEYSTQTVGGGQVSIASTLNQVVSRVEKNPIVGYRGLTSNYYAYDYTLGEAGEQYYGTTTLLDLMERYGDFSQEGYTITLYSLFHVRNPYTVTIRTAVNGTARTFSMPELSDEYIFTAEGRNASGYSVSLSCDPFEMIDISVTDKLVYYYNQTTRQTTFYSFDNISIGNSVLSESGEYSFQMIPTNNTSSVVISINFKEEFTINNNILNSDNSINYSASIWEVDSSTDLLNIAYRMYCQGLPLAKKIVQTADIDFEGGYMLPIGTESNPFESVYDGGYYRIENMNIAGGNAVDMGLFGYTDGATIKNLTLMNSSVSGRGNVGAVIGYGNDTTLERVGVYDGTTTLMEEQASGTGIFLTNGTSVASINKASGTYTNSALGNNSTRYTILNVMIEDAVENSSDEAGYAGDLAGNLNNSTIDTCYERKSNTENSEIGGLVGRATSGSITYSYTSRARVAHSSSGVSQSHAHTGVTNISSTCGTCADRFIW